jgi:hypothetical protein
VFLAEISCKKVDLALKLVLVAAVIKSNDVFSMDIARSNAKGSTAQPGKGYF